MGSSEEARVDESDLRQTSSDEVKFDGSLEFVHEYGDNGSKPSYQETSGAPVENISPLVLQVTWFTTIFLNNGQMVGTGVFSTRKSFQCTQHDSFVLMYLALAYNGSQQLPQSSKGTAPWASPSHSGHSAL
jgi:hypothetical protein